MDLLHFLFSSFKTRLTNFNAIQGQWLILRINTKNGLGAVRVSPYMVTMAPSCGN